MPRTGDHLITHGHTRDYQPSSTYTAWANMIGRCTRSSRPDFHHYGGRGITVCDAWRKFENFLADMGQKPHPSLTLDRIDVNGNYEPGNCRWATWSEQGANRRAVEVCKRGHLMEGDNVRIDKSNERIQRSCRTCSNMMHRERRRQARASL